MIVDSLGTEIKPGCFIVYAAGGYQSRITRKVGRVVSMTPKRYRAYFISELTRYADYKVVHTGEWGLSFDVGVPKCTTVVPYVERFRPHCSACIKPLIVADGRMGDDDGAPVWLCLGKDCGAMYEWFNENDPIRGLFPHLKWARTKETSAPIG